MPRRSLRLIEAGYYKEDGTPVISYRGDFFNGFKKHKQSSDNNRVRAQERVEVKKLQKIQAQPKTSCCPVMFVLSLMVTVLLTSWSFTNHAVNNMQQEMTQSLNTFLLPIRADAMPNFANPLNGATVVKSQSSDTYVRPGTDLRTRISSWWSPKQMNVLEHHSPLVLGQCWPFKGDHGQLQVCLADTIKVTHVTLGHYTKMQTPGFISSAPKKFSVYGLQTVDGEATLLGRFEYDQDGPSFQTFTMPDNNNVFRHVRVEINNNWGNDEYTCLYSFRVHGKLPTPSTT